MLALRVPTLIGRLREASFTPSSSLLRPLSSFFRYLELKKLSQARLANKRNRWKLSSLSPSCVAPARRWLCLRCFVFCTHIIGRTRVLFSSSSLDTTARGNWCRAMHRRRAELETRTRTTRLASVFIILNIPGPSRSLNSRSPTVPGWKATWSIGIAGSLPGRQFPGFPLIPSR